MDRPRIVFMGTPEFALPSLQILIDRRENLAGVVTQPDKPVGRGQHVKLTPIKELALKHHIAVFQPQRVKSPDFVQQLKTLAPDLVVVAAYGQIFSRALLDIPSCGFINVHSSLLPSYRGAAPINWALINGDTETGVTIMLLDEGMDTGDILLQGATSILADENASMLHDRLAGLGAKLLGKTLDMLRSGSWSPVPQNHEQATYAPMLKKKDGRILWDQDALSIANQVRGMTPWPGCYTYLQGKLLKIHWAVPVEREAGVPPGKIISASQKGIEVATGKGSLLIKDVQLEGKKKMTTEDFLKGHRLASGEEFTATR
jgi:methionyl-tRNA formyltransferase